MYHVVVDIVIGKTTGLHIAQIVETAYNLLYCFCNIFVNIKVILFEGQARWQILIFVFTFSSEQERDKFEYIFQTYKKLMLHKAYDILRDYTLAEDAASEAFIRIYKNLHKIDNPNSNSSIAFVATVVKNVSLTMLQREKGHFTEEYDEDQSDRFNLEEETLSQLSSEHIYQTIDRLGEDLKGVFLLKYSYNLSHKEIGKILGISENNVTVRLHRAKNKLAALLRNEGYCDA